MTKRAREEADRWDDTESIISPLRQTQRLVERFPELPEEEIAHRTVTSYRFVRTILSIIGVHHDRRFHYRGREVRVLDEPALGEHFAAKKEKVKIVILNKKRRELNGFQVQAALRIKSYEKGKLLTEL